jgi:hypothetical protein
MRNSSCVQDSARARSASLGTDSRSAGAFSARVKNVTSPDRSRAVFAATVITRHPAVHAERGVIVS